MTCFFPAESAINIDSLTSTAQRQTDTPSSAALCPVDLHVTIRKPAYVAALDLYRVDYT